MRLNWSRLVSAFLCLTLSLSGEEPVGRKQVSYNTFKVRKAFFVPKAPQWGTIDDFDIFYNGKKAVPGKRPARTVCRLSRTETDLLLHITAFEPLKIRDNNKTDFHNLWRGDLFEIFFGGMEPEPWCMQFVAGAGGGRFSDTLPLEKWQAKAKVGKGKYELHIRIPLAALKVHNGGIGFNISRQRYRELSVWAMVHYGFHEPENFGELLLDDYAAIFEQRFGVSGRHIKSREDFERETVKRSIPVTDIQYGPRLLYPGPDAMTVAWESAGKTFGIIEYRKAGEKKFNISAAGTVNGVPVAAACHRAALTGLEPDSVYEYQVANLHPVTRQKKVSKLYRFRTFPAKAKDFTGVFFCDAHGGFENLKRLFKNPDIARADFVCNLGDMHSMMTGMDAVQHGYLDVQTKFLAGSRPLVFVRGNHEVRGIANDLFDRFLGHPSGKSHFIMRYGDVSFMIADTGDPQFDLYGAGKRFREQQKKWIREKLQDPAFADASFKILLSHIPPCGNKDIQKMFDGCFEKSKPDLMLCGHEHVIRFFKTGEKTPFPLCIGYGALVLKATGYKITLIAVNWQGKTVGTWHFTKRKGK